MNKHITEKILNLIFPPVCPLCGEVLKIKTSGACAECRAKISYIKPPVCLRCGKEIEDGENALCSDCSNHTRSYIRGYPAMNYVDPLPESIAAFKYKNRREYGRFFAGEIARQCGQDILAVQPDVLVPVPVHAAKRRKRGYNQAEILAEELGAILGIPVDASLIRRSVNTLPQKELDHEEREKNLKKAFISTDKIVEYKRAVLVDDIYTTGSTVEACTQVLHASGVTKVYYTSICIGKGY